MIEATGTDANGATTSGDMTVRAPVASDLAEYVKQLHGKGTKLAATIDTSLGTIHCELFGDKAPLAVANFVGLATGQKAFKSSSGTPVKKKFFDGLTFHRVIPTFMVQGGDPEGSGRGGPGYEFKNEVAGLKMGPGALAMATPVPTPTGASSSSWRATTRISRAATPTSASARRSTSSRRSPTPRHRPGTSRSCRW